MVNRQSNRMDWVSVSLVVALSHPLALTAIAGMGAMAIAPATYAATLTAWRFDASSRQLEITVPEGTTPRYFLLAQPARIVIDLPNTQLGTVSAQQAYAGAVRQIRVSQFEPNTARIVMELAPQVELAPGQVELRPASSSQTNRWVLRPLIAGDSPAIAAAPVAPTSPLPAVAAAPVETPSPVAPAASPAVVTPPAASLPPLEPGGVELSVDPPPASSAAAAPSTPPAAPVEPSASSTPPVAARVVESPSPSAPVSTEAAEPEAAEPSTDLADALPPPSFDGAPPVSVSVPPVGQAIAPPQDPALLDSAQRQAEGLMTPPIISAAPAAEAAPPVSPPPLPSNPASLAPTAPAPVNAPAAVEFGQPLPLSSASSPSRSPVVAASNPNVLLPSGTVLSARYPGGSALELSAGEPWQEVLVLTQPVVDGSGRLLFPPGSPVIGRFETGQQGSRFVAQAVSVNGQTIPIQAESEPLAGDRELSQNNILLNSAIGAAAVGVLSGFSGVGLLGGLAAGAATGYFTSPKPAVIEPNQIVQIRLTADLPRF